MLLNSLSSTRFAPPPASTRVAQPSLAPAHQQREGVTIHPDNVDWLTPKIEEMFKELNDALRIQAFSDPSINPRELMEELRTQWNSFITRDDGFFLQAITDAPKLKARQLTLETNQLSPTNRTIGESLTELQDMAYEKQQTSILTPNGQELPTYPRLFTGYGTAILTPHISLTDPKKVQEALKNTKAVIRIFNEAIKD